MFSRQCVYLLALILLVSVSNSFARPHNSVSEGDDVQTIYLPYYGGAKGQYLEIKKDMANGGVVISERIVDNEIDKDEEVVLDVETIPTMFNHDSQKSKYSCDKMMLLLLKAQIQGLTDQEKDTIKELLSSAEMTSTTAPVAAVDKNELFEQNVGEESDPAPNPGSSGESTGLSGNSNGVSVAEAKPVGLAVAGIGGIAASRPIATAVANASGFAIARPIATAIAGIDPATLGIGTQVSDN